jgi:hypothetical protein
MGVGPGLLHKERVVAVILAVAERKKKSNRESGCCNCCYETN